jgi:hypothetical protein
MTTLTTTRVYALEFAADTIRLLMKRCVMLAGLFERLEAEL